MRSDLHRSATCLLPLLPSLPFLLAVGCARPAPEGPETAGVGPDPAARVYAAYTLLAPEVGGGTIAIARVIVDDGQPCPTLSGGLEPIGTAPRAKPEHPAHFLQHFPVTVCEARVPFEQALAVDGTPIRLGKVGRRPTRVFVYGDTGCKEKDCGTAVAEPFQQLTRAGAALPDAPALILHMGDMNYRGTGWSVDVDGKPQPVYDAGDMVRTDSECRYTSPYYSQNANDSATPDVWENWNNDLFLAAAELLPVAPWVFARGNHELCSRAGPGWFYFLGPGADGVEGALPQTSCKDQGSLADPPADAFGQIVTVAPYVLELGTLRLQVLDSANACDGFADNTQMTAAYTRQFETLADRVIDDAETWIMTHRPIWGIEEYSGSYAVGNVMMQMALARTRLGALPPAVELSLAGHQHNYESLTFPAGSGRPPQLVIGNSGVSLGGSELKGDFCLPIDGLQANGNSADGCKTCTQSYGFLDLARDAEGSWRGTVANPATRTVVATCELGADPICRLASDLGGEGCPAAPASG